MALLRWVLIFATLMQFGWLAASPDETQGEQDGFTTDAAQGPGSRPPINVQCDGTWERREGQWICVQTGKGR